MKKFIKISSFVIAAILTALGAISIASLIISVFKGVEIYGKMIKGIVSLVLVFAVGLTLLFVKKDYKSKKFWVVLGIAAFVCFLDRFVLDGTSGYGSAIFNLIVQGTAVTAKTVISVLLILTMLYSLVVLFLAVMEKETSKK